MAVKPIRIEILACPFKEFSYFLVPRVLGEPIEEFLVVGRTAGVLRWTCPFARLDECTATAVPRLRLLLFDSNRVLPAVAKVIQIPNNQLAHAKSLRFCQVVSVIQLSSQRALPRAGFQASGRRPWRSCVRSRLSVETQPSYVRDILKA